jgi:hypothetical protein
MNGFGWSTIYFKGIRRSFLAEKYFFFKSFSQEEKSHLGLGSLLTFLADGRFLE